MEYGTLIKDSCPRKYEEDIFWYFPSASKRAMSMAPSAELKIEAFSTLCSDSRANKVFFTSLISAISADKSRGE